MKKIKGQKNRPVSSKIVVEGQAEQLPGHQNVKMDDRQTDKHEKCMANRKSRNNHFFNNYQFNSDSGQ